MLVEDTHSFLPSVRTLDTLREASQGCHGCALYVNATRTVFGEGTSRARIFLVGEQPGDFEDRTGRPFVGPAGRLLDRALGEAGIARESTYLTNAVKHFNFEPRGKARLHKKPKPGDVRACRPWLEAELEVVRPRVLLLMGAVAAQALLGSAFRVTRSRGLVQRTPLAPALATWHPSNVLRARDSDGRRQLFEELLSDLRRARAIAEDGPQGDPGDG